MKQIAQFREENPQYKGISDSDLTKALHNKYYSTVDFNEFSSGFMGNQQGSIDDNNDKGGMGAAFGAGVDKLQELGYRAVKGFTDVGGEGDGIIEQDGALANFAQEGIDRNIEEQKEYVPTVGSYKDIDSIGDAFSYTGELVANSIPYMAAAMSGVGATVMAGGLSQEAYEAQPEDEKNALRALASGTGQMALERLGSRLAFGEIGKSIMKDGFIHTAKRMHKGDLVNLAKDPATALAFSRRVLQGAAGEGLTETMQESLAMWGAGKDLNEFKLLDHNESNDDFLGSDGQRLMESFVGGATVGGVIRGTTESAQKLMSWQKKSAPIAKNGIDELVKQGVTQDEAIEQVRGQLITSAMNQGLSEAEAAAAAARTMKTEYDIDHEIFTPIANDVASRRAAMNERLNQQRIDGGIGDVQNALNGTTSPSADELVQQQMQTNAPEFFEQLDAQEVNKVTKEEEFLPDPRTEEQWNADQDQAQADWEATFDADKTPEEHKQAFEAKQKAEQPQKAKIQGLEVTEAPVNELLLSNDVPQFKDGANDKGVVEPLGGKFERTGVAPIQVWVRKDGKKEVISGRHRLDLAKRSGEETIPAQYHYEEDGFNQAKAASLDAILNVREGQGKVKDYVEFIKDAGLSEKEADAQGILGRATGKRAYTIANLGSDSLIAAHRNDGITDEGATRIAKAAPNNEALQAVGIKAINDGKSITVAENLVKAVKSMTNDQQQSTGDLFGFDDSAMIEAENLAKAASKKQAEIQRSLSAIKGAAKNPALAAKEGVNVKNPKAVNERIEQLKENKRQWDNWHTNPKLVDELTGPIPPLPKQETPIKTASQEVVSVSEPKESDGTVIDDGTITQEPDLFTEKSIDEAAHEAATSPKNDLAEPTIAQAEANNYKLGRIKHSGFDIGIENPEGSNRTGIDPNGKEWSVKMTAHYGDLTGSIGADGDALDVFVKPSTTDSEKVFVVDQINPGDGKFDEAKILMGFDSKEEAEAVYLSNYSKGWKGLGNITEVSKDDFKAWVKDGDTTKPFAVSKPVDSNEIGEISKDLSSKIQRQSGKIILEEGNGKFGRVHIDERHSKEINGLGYSVDEFVQEVTKNYNTVYKADNGELLLAKRNGKDYLMFVRLKPSENGDFYSVSTAYPAEKRTLNNRLKKEKVSLLWESIEPHSKPISKTSAFAHRSDNKADSEEPSVTRHNKVSITPKPKTDKIDDFGEVLQGANKHNYTFNEKLNDDVDVKAVPLSKSFPQPDYEKLAGEGADPRALAFMAQLRGEIKPKPRQAGKVERWSHQVSEARHNAKKLLEMGEGGSDTMIASLQKSGKGHGSYLKYLPLILDIAKEIPAKNIKALGKFKLTHSFYNLYHGEKDVHKWVVTNTEGKGGFGGMGNMTHFDTSEEAVAFIKSQVTDESIVNGKKLAKFDIWHERGNRDVVFLGKKVGTGKFIELKQFPTVKEARQYSNENNAELVALLKDKKKIKAHRRKDNNPRIGDDHRKGVNADAEMFDKAFGFRGVQFGNWVEGHKRQDDLNFAYDGLMDLASVIGVPPKALSLNGELGLAFGARGKGGDNAAMAHYESGSVVINLTKKMGAGSLAHEWWHALDNYFSKMDNSKLGGVDKQFMSEGGRRLGVRKDGKHQRATPEDFGARQEVYEAFTALTKAIKNETKLAERSAELDKLRGKDYWGTVIEMTARSFERYVIDKLASQGFESDYLANIVKESSTEASKEISDYPYPLAVEMDVVNKAYDGIFDILQTKETDQGIALFSRSVIPDSVAIGVSNTSTVSQADTDVVIESIINVEGSLLDKDHFVVVSTFNELPSDIKDAAKDQDAENGIGGVHYKGKTYLVRDKLADAQEVESTIFHETYGHYGIRKLFGKELPKKLNQLLQGIGGIAGLDKIAKKHNIDLLPYKKGLAQSSLTNAQAQTVLMDELLAHLAQDNKPSIKRMVKEVIGAIRQGLRRLGYKRLKEVTDSELFYVLKQARAAAHQAKGDGNSDIRFSRAGGDANQAAPENQSESINVPDETKKDYVIRRMQDKLRRLKVVQRKLDVNEDNDTYMAEEAYHGKVADDLHNIEISHTNKIAELMAEHDLSQDEVDLYLIAKHAQERNAYIDTINPELNGAGSGMSNEAAQAILDKALLENKRVALESVSTKVYDLLKIARDKMVEFGLEPQDAIDTWQSQYEFYVPLKGYAAEDGKKGADGKKFGAGKGFNIKGRETIKAMGRRSLAESPLLHAISDTTQSIIRARKNEVGNSFLKLVEDNPDPELWQTFTAQNPDKKRGEITVDGVKTIGLVNMTAFEMKASDDYYKTKIDGVERYIKIHDPLLLRAMGNLGVDETNMLTQNLGKVTRLLSALVTTWNPEFMLTNFSRDIQAAVANLLAETQVADGKALNTDHLVKKMLSSLPKSMAVLKKGFRENDFSDPEWGSYLKEFLSSGAKTGWVNQKDIGELANELKGTISRASNTNTGKARRSGKAVADFVRDYNDIVENATRFSVYYHARKQGVTVKKASSLAKNLTINFNRKGEVGNTMNAIYMFANASVQGTANMLRALATPKDRSKSMWNPQFYNTSQKLAIASIGATVLMANVMRELGGDDEDGVPLYDKVEDHVKATNFVILTGGKDENGDVNYAAIPMPYGYNVLGAIGHAIDGATQGKPVGKQAVNLLMTILGAFSPIGMQESESVEKGFAKTIAPTVLKPFVELAVNENFFGSNIFPEQRGYSANKADAHLGNAYTWEWTKNLTTWLNDNTGGSTFQSGGIDIAPQSIDHLVKFMGGGVLQFAARWQNLAVKASNDEEIKRGDIPFLRRFFKQLNPKAAIGEFYDNKELLNGYLADFKSLHGPEKATYYKANQSQLQLAKYGNGIEKALRLLNAKKRSVESSKLSKEDKAEKIRLIDDRKIELTLRFSKKKQELGLKNLN